MYGSDIVCSSMVTLVYYQKRYDFYIILQEWPAIAYFKIKIV
mgnify:CR=1 FL=1